jgi:hypothetical protein
MSSARHSSPLLDRLLEVLQRLLEVGGGEIGRDLLGLLVLAPGLVLARGLHRLLVQEPAVLQLVHALLGHELDGVGHRLDGVVPVALLRERAAEAVPRRVVVAPLLDRALARGDRGLELLGAVVLVALVERADRIVARLVRAPGGDEEQRGSGGDPDELHAATVSRCRPHLKPLSRRNLRSGPPDWWK